ncbi:purine/pyrimidine permease [Neobacillus citreus]|uniref:Purine/pyrimidine permease n=1 Tax=Neobacillus citreus TaxID=2833578 RepID=A0A942T7J8_9BACI|nr:purine/pyrimidine permease [Neobacillus citreus]MCH6265542.1 purine/pyrimidine permease [Neobacillus citreus]
MKEQTIKDSGLITSVQGIQWAVFMLTNVIAVPVVVGAAFHMAPAEIADFMQRMLFVTGIATLIQIFFGHRLPLVEGAAGMWWAIFILLGTMSTPANQGNVLQQLEMGLIIAGILLAIIGFLPIIEKIRLLFTPIVTGVYLILLVSQLSGSFLKSMLGFTATGHLNGKITLISFLVIFIILFISLKTNGILRSLGPLVGIIVGWTMFHFLGLIDTNQSYEPSRWFSIPKMFAWGTPKFDIGIILTTLLTSVVLISNVISSVLVVGLALEKRVKPNQYQKGIFGNGVGLIFSGLFSVVGVIPLAISAGFIMTTGIKKLLPLIIGAILITVSGFFPYIGGFLATLPLEVAYASLFTMFTQLLGFGIRDLMGQEPTGRNLMVIGISLMTGIGIMFLPPEAFENIAPWLRNIVSNGLLIGLILCFLLEHLVFQKKMIRQTS